MQYIAHRCDPVVKPRADLCLRHFAACARRAAARLDIGLRTVDTVTLEDVVSWCRLSHLDVQVLETKDHDFDSEYRGQSFVVSFIHTEDGLSVMLDADRPDATPERVG
jgi:hypothetical protein